MNQQDKFNRFVNRYPHNHTPFFHRPHWSRRQFFNLIGGGVTASMLSRVPVMAGDTTAAASVSAQNTAKNVIFILLSGAMSQIDTFDFKTVPGVTPDSFRPETINGVVWPTGLLPKLVNNLPDMVIARSVRSWALVHSLAQTWTQIGRNPAAALGDIAPNIGSVVSIIKEPERATGQVFPTFVALNSNQAAGPGYLPATFAPFKLNPDPRNPARGLPNSLSPSGAATANNRWNLMREIDDPLRTNSPFGRDVNDYDQFYRSAKALMDNADPGGAVDRAFKFTAQDVTRYGNSNFGAACLVAKQVLAANQGTRYIQITQGGWDMHTNIYAPAALPAMGPMLDSGLSALLDDLKASGLLSETLVVMMGEFGRTVGRLSAAQGRDHFLQQFAMFAGAGIKGGRVIGSTIADGSRTDTPGWARNRDIRVEDVEATIYSAMGINWTTIRNDDPTGRGFELVPFSEQDLYGPINELWA